MRIDGVNLSLDNLFQDLLEIVVGEKWPDGDEGAMRRLADAWSTAATALAQVQQTADAAARAVAQYRQGAAGESFQAFWASNFDDGRTSRPKGSAPAALPFAVQFCQAMAKTLNDGATQIETTKDTIIGNITILVATVTPQLVAGFFDFGATDATAIAEVAVERTAMEAFLQGVKELLLHMAEQALEQGLQQAELNFVIQAKEWSEGETSGINWKTVGTSGLGGAAGGALGAGFGKGVGGLGGKVFGEAFGDSAGGRITTGVVSGQLTNLTMDLAQTGTISSGDLFKGSAAGFLGGFGGHGGGADSVDDGLSVDGLSVDGLSGDGLPSVDNLPGLPTGPDLGSVGTGPDLPQVDGVTGGGGATLPSGADLPSVSNVDIPHVDPSGSTTHPDTVSTSPSALRTTLAGLDTHYGPDDTAGQSGDGTSTRPDATAGGGQTLPTVMPDFSLSDQAGPVGPSADSGSASGAGSGDRISVAGPKSTSETSLASAVDAPTAELSGTHDPGLDPTASTTGHGQPDPVVDPRSGGAGDPLAGRRPGDPRAGATTSANTDAGAVVDARTGSDAGVGADVHTRTDPDSGLRADTITDAGTPPDQRAPDLTSPDRTPDRIPDRDPSQSPATPPSPVDRPLPDRTSDDGTPPDRTEPGPVATPVDPRPTRRPDPTTDPTAPDRTTDPSGDHSVAPPDSRPTTDPGTTHSAPDQGGAPDHGGVPHHSSGPDHGTAPDQNTPDHSADNQNSQNNQNNHNGQVEPVPIPVRPGPSPTVPDDGRGQEPGGPGRAHAPYDPYAQRPQFLDPRRIPGLVPRKTLDAARPTGRQGGLKPVEPEYQRAVENAVPRNRDGSPAVRPKLRRGWVGKVNDGGPRSDPGRGNNCVDCTRAGLATFYGEPRASAARFYEVDASGRQNMNGEVDGYDNMEAWTGAKYAPDGWGAAGLQSVENKVRAAGPGSSAAVVVQWPPHWDPATARWVPSGAHQVAIINDRGTVKWVDFQSKKISKQFPGGAVDGVTSIVLDADRNPVVPGVRFDPATGLPIADRTVPQQFVPPQQAVYPTQPVRHYGQPTPPDPRTQYAPPDPRTQYTPPPDPRTQVAPPPDPRTQYGQAPDTRNYYGQAPDPRTQYGQAPDPRNQYGQAPDPRNHYGQAPDPRTQYGQAPDPRNQYPQPPDPWPQDLSTPDPRNQFAPPVDPLSQHAPAPDPRPVSPLRSTPTDVVHADLGTDRTTNPDPLRAPDSATPDTEFPTVRATAPVDPRSRFYGAAPDHPAEPPQHSTVDPTHPTHPTADPPRPADRPTPSVLPHNLMDPDMVRSRVAEANEWVQSRPDGLAAFSDPKMLDQARKVPEDPNGAMTIDMHSDGRSMRVGLTRLDVQGVYELALAHGLQDRQPIRLLGCEAGRDGDGLAAQLAELSGRPVIAADTLVFTDDVGHVFATGGHFDYDGQFAPDIPPTGRWHEFAPDGTRTQLTDSGFPPGYEDEGFGGWASPVRETYARSGDVPEPIGGGGEHDGTAPGDPTHTEADPTAAHNPPASDRNEPQPAPAPSPSPTDTSPETPPPPPAHHEPPAHTLPNHGFGPPTHARSLPDPSILSGPRPDRGTIPPKAAEDPADIGRAGRVDADGSWTSGNNDRLRLTADQRRQVFDFLDQGADVEQRVTDVLLGVENRMPDARLAGLEFRQKLAGSLSDKLAGKLRENDRLTIGDVIPKIKDSVRYTLCMPEQDYTAGVADGVAALGEHFELSEYRNAWGGEGYQGINTVWADPETGLKFEVQFHTPESLYAKEFATHEWYEKQRVLDDGDPLKAQYAAWQNDAFRAVPRPEGAVGLDPRRPDRTEPAAVTGRDTPPTVPPDQSGVGAHSPPDPYGPHGPNGPTDPISPIDPTALSGITPAAHPQEGHPPSPGGAPHPDGPTAADLRRRQNAEAKAALAEQLTPVNPHTGEVVSRLVDDKNPLNLTDRLRDPETRPETIATLREISTSHLLDDHSLTEYLEEHPGQGPLFDRVTRAQNHTDAGAKRLDEYVARTKSAGPAREIGGEQALRLYAHLEREDRGAPGPDLSPEDAQRLAQLRDYADGLAAQVLPTAVGELRDLLSSLPLDEAAAVNARAKTARGLVDKVGRMAGGWQGRDPRPDYQVGEVIDAVGARITVGGAADLGRVLAAVKARFGTGDGGRVLEIENMYAQPKRGNKAYRVVPLVVSIEVDHVPYTYELQLTTRRASVAADMEHNSVYKNYVSATPAEAAAVRRAMQEAAAIEQSEGGDR